MKKLVGIGTLVAGILMILLGVFFAVFSIWILVGSAEDIVEHRLWRVWRDGPRDPWDSFVLVGIVLGIVFGVGALFSLAIGCLLVFLAIKILRRKETRATFIVLSVLHLFSVFVVFWVTRTSGWWNMLLCIPLTFVVLCIVLAVRYRKIDRVQRP